KRLYILQQMEKENTVYNNPKVVPLEDKADVQKLEKTFKKIIQRHESLRTSFHMRDGLPIQQVQE
ncbi:MAG: hypothetical protein GTN53_43325, partial [Candidatus Aminicenantes bacterium]|nr:hypothetical protein [Candidatus Aminicenantes bacterium]NIQ73318.1 hypothetical protein [Candidatus Aminicenantes bacterium]NIT29350.1 hypothetical protein [Candidatus Aminicenantes bacterium]